MAERQGEYVDRCQITQKAAKYQSVRTVREALGFVRGLHISSPLRDGKPNPSNDGERAELRLTA